MVTTPLQWKSPTSVGATADEERTPDIVQLSNGNYLVVYAGTNAAGVGSPAGSDILGQIYDPLGNTVGGIIRLNTNFSADEEITPSIAALPGGGFVVTYVDLDVNTASIPPTFDSDIRIEVYGNAGNFLRGTTILSTTPGFSIPALGPEIAVSSDTNALVVWEDVTNADVVAQRYNPTTGALIGGPITVFGGATGTGEGIRGTAVTVLNNGSYVVAYGDQDNGANDQLFLKIITTGGTVGSPVLVADSLAENYDPSLAALSNGNFVVSWTADGSGGSDTGVRVKVFNASGTAITGDLVPPTSTAGNQVHSTVAATDTGFIVFWADETLFDIRGQRYTNGGVKVGAEFVVENFGATQLTSLQSTTFEDGRVALTWEANFTSSDDVRHAIWDPRDNANAPDSNGRVIGTTQNDSITLTSGTVEVYGHTGNDTVTVANNLVDPASVFDGGTGTDTLQLAAGSGTWNFEGETVRSFEILQFDNLGAGGFTSQSQTYQTFASQFGDFTTVNFGTGGLSNSSTLRITMGATTTLDLSGLTINGFTGFNTGPFLSLGVDRIEINGDSSIETITGTSVDDAIFGGSGNDTLNGGGGNDTIEGGAGADSMTGGTGTNTLSYAGSSAAVNVSLAGSASGGDATGDVFSGFQNLTGSANGDTLNGDSAANVLIGADGSDFLNGNAGSDTIYGGAGADQITGGSIGDEIYGDAGDDGINGESGIDTLYGGADNDTFFMSGGDFTDDVYGGTGTDTLHLGGIAYGGFTGFSVNLGTNTYVNNGGGEGTRTVESIERVIGSSQADDMLGTTGSQEFYGGSGNDTLDGGADGDTMSGGLGNDVFVVDSYSDVVTEGAGQGTDTILTSLTAYSIFSNANVENLTGTGASANLTGNTGNNVLTGTNGNDVLTGSSGNDTLIGNGGDDTLNGGSGTNRMEGGSGDDTYVVSDFSDVLIEGVGAGIDTVETALGAFSIFSKANIENITSTTSAGVTLTGNSLDNVLTGNTGNDTLIGSTGNDTLNGGAGADSMDGGTGDDVYVVDSYGDIVSETAGNGTDRIDTELSSFSIFSLANVENLRGFSSGGQTLTGNTGNNDIIGDSGNDLLIGSSGDDTLDGNQGNDTLDGGTGTNVMEGGVGDDTYIVSSFTDVLIENAASGIDTVQTSLGAFSIFSKANIENITSTTVASVALTGNTLDNVLTGNAGNDTINGFTGNDTMVGNAGDDTFVVDSFSDVVTELAGQGTDEIQTSLGAYSIFSQANIENLTSTSATGATLTGNVGNNVISGGGGGDNLIASAGNDTLIGNSGNDTLDGGSGSDQMTGGSGLDVFLFSAAPSASNVDTVTDFNVADDIMHLNAVAFAGIGAAGALGAAQFAIGAAATTAAQRVIYNSGTGDLFFDADGSGAGAQVLFGNLSTGLSLTSADFLIV